MPPAIPESITFQDAIALSQTLLAQAEQGEVTEAELETAIAALVLSQNGARGFFVTYLTGDSPLADQPSEAVIEALQTAPGTVADLLTKNLAMSSAMAVAHRRNQNEEMAQGSEQVRSRTIHLIHRLPLAELQTRLAQLHQSVTTGEGPDEPFLQRWGYDTEQRQAIATALQTVFNEPT